MENWLYKLEELVREKKKLTEIKAYVNSAPEEAYPSIISILVKDERKAMLTFCQQLLKKYDAYCTEVKRMAFMFTYEDEASQLGYLKIAGVDEAGRGPLVGPVVAACVILDRQKDWSGINDSKKLSADKRTYFYEKIVDTSVAWAVGISDHHEIDAMNILNATKLAMTRAIEQIKPDYLLIDALTLPNLSTIQKGIIKGDSQSASIAAASIVAKVTRDRMLLELHEKYPMYRFDKHKGYGTKEHYEAINTYGLISEHRRSFLKSI